jgi:hypothetical protein
MGYGKMQKLKEYGGVEINIHAVLKYLLKDLNNDVEDAGYDDGVFWYALRKR